jgi:penicillin-binding protein 1A
MVTAIALAVVCGGALVCAIAVASVVMDVNSRGLKEIRLGENTQVFDRNGDLLGLVPAETNRTEVSEDLIPRELEDATVAIEDKRFYKHGGVDYSRIVGAAVHDLQHGSTTQGGSTITMQLIKNLYDPGAARTITRKLQEAYLAYQYEHKYSKSEILTKYLNGVFYGNNAVGVEAAAQTYFNKTVSDISLPQAALLAGLPQAPSAYDPFNRPEVARERRNTVLDQMADQGYISEEKAERAKRSGLALKRGTAYHLPKEAFFFEYVRQLLVERYGEKEVQQGGFKVYTTVDPHFQEAARTAIRERLGLSTDPASAVVMIDTRTGFIRAMESSQTFTSQSQFNFAAQARRQTGSTAKTFVLAAAIEAGISPSTIYWSRPLNFDDDEYGHIEVSTYSHSYGGPTDIRSATLASDNTVFQQLALDVGPSKVVDIAERMGIPPEHRLPNVASVALGSGEVTPLDMAVAYAPLSNGGLRVEPRAIVRVVKPDGTTEVFKPKRKRAFTDGVSYEVSKILEANIQGGTGVAARLSVPAAGKTGTTDDYTDAWFVGYTPHFSTSVWVGYPNSDGIRRSMYNVHGRTVSGGSFPAEIWGDFMRVVTENAPYEEFAQPTHPAVFKPFTSPFTEEAQAEAARLKEEELKEEKKKAARKRKLARLRREARERDEEEAAQGENQPGGYPSEPAGSNPPPPVDPNAPDPGTGVPDPGTSPPVAEPPVDPAGEAPVPAAPPPDAGDVANGNGRRAETP